MKKRTLWGAFFIAIIMVLLPVGAFAKATTAKKVAAKTTVQNKKTVAKTKTNPPAGGKKTSKKVVKKTTKKGKKKKVAKHKDKINTTIAPLIDPSNPPGGQ